MGALVQMLEELTDVHASLVGQVFSHTQQSVTQSQANMQGVKQSRSQFSDPIINAEAELKRINTILATPAIPTPSNLSRIISSVWIWCTSILGNACIANTAYATELS